MILCPEIWDNTGFWQATKDQEDFVISLLWCSHNSVLQCRSYFINDDDMALGYIHYIASSFSSKTLRKPSISQTSSVVRFFWRSRLSPISETSFPICIFQNIPQQRMTEQGTSHAKKKVNENCFEAKLRVHNHHGYYCLILFLLKSSWDLPSLCSNIMNSNGIANLLLMNLKFPHANFDTNLLYVTNIPFYVVKYWLTGSETGRSTLSSFLIIM